MDHDDLDIMVNDKLIRFSSCTASTFIHLDFPFPGTAGQHPITAAQADLVCLSPWREDGRGVWETLAVPVL